MLVLGVYFWVFSLPEEELLETFPFFWLSMFSLLFNHQAQLCRAQADTWFSGSCGCSDVGARDGVICVVAGLWIPQRKGHLDIPIFVLGFAGALVPYRHFWPYKKISWLPTNPCLPFLHDPIPMLWVKPLFQAGKLCWHLDLICKSN